MIDLIANQPHYLAHCAPIWGALPPSARGRVIVPRELDAQARVMGSEPERSPEGNAPVLVASWVDYHRAHRAGRTRIAETQHGIGQSYTSAHPSYPGGTGRLPDSLFLVPNEHAANRWHRAYPRSTVEVTGSPRLDALPTYEPEAEPIIAISSHFDVTFVPEGRSAFGWFSRAIPDLAERFRLIGHAHPRIAGTLERWYRRHGIPFVADFDDVLRTAALYITDNSSSLYEFAATGRPVVVLNPPFYRRDVHHGLRFWEASTVGVNVDAPGELVDAVAFALSDPPEQQAAREAALDIAYARRSGAAAYAAAALLAWADAVPIRVAA